MVPLPKLYRGIDLSRTRNDKIYTGSGFFYNRANFKTSHFAQSLRQAQILILEILNLFVPAP